jgi:hypothetical protein
MCAQADVGDANRPSWRGEEGCDNIIGKKAGEWWVVKTSCRQGLWSIPVVCRYGGGQRRVVAEW